MLDKPLRTLLDTDVAPLICQDLASETILQLILDATVSGGAAGQMAPKVIESAHEYSNDMRYNEEIYFPGARKLMIEFDPRCNTESGCDRVYFYTESN